MGNRYVTQAASGGDGLDLRGFSIVNGSYDHTGGASGERQLTATGSFSSYTWVSGDKVYLLNAVGGVADGEYEIASKVDANVILLVADAGLTADSTTDVDSSAGPWTLVEASTVTTGAQPGDIVWVKNDGTTYTLTSDWASGTAGTATDPIMYVGFKDLPGDGYQGRDSTNNFRLILTHMPDILMSGGGVNFRPGKIYNLFDSLRIRSATVTSNVVFDIGTGNSQGISNSSIELTGTGGANAGCVYMSAYCHVHNCDLIDTATTSGGAIVLQNTNSATSASIIHSTNGWGIGTAAGEIVGNLIYKCGKAGINRSGTSARGAAMFNTIAGCLEGILIENALNDDLYAIVGNLLTDNDNYGIDCEYVSGGLPLLIQHNRFDRNGTMPTNNIETWLNQNSETTGVSQVNEYTDYANDDFSLVSTSPAMSNGILPNSNTGWWQNAASSGGGGTGTIGPGGGMIGIAQ